MRTLREARSRRAHVGPSPPEGFCFRVRPAAGILLFAAIPLLAACEDVRLPSIRTAPPLLEAPWLPTRTLPLAAVIGVSDAPTRTPTPTPRPRLDASGSQLGVVAQLEAAASARPVTGLAFSPTGSLLAVAASGEPVRLWDVASSRLVQEFASNASAVAFSADGELLAIASGSQVEVFRPEGSAEVRILGGEGGPPELELAAPTAMDHLAFTQDGRLVGAGQSEMLVWDSHSGAVIAEEGLGAAVDSLLSMNGELLVTYVYPGRVDVRETTQGFFLRSISIGTSEYTGNMLAISPDQAELVTYAPASGQSETRFWSLENGEGVRAFQLGLSDPVAAYAADGNILALSRGAGLVLLSPRINLVLDELAGRIGNVTAVAVSPGGETVASGTAVGSVFLWGVVPPRAPTPVPTATSMEPSVPAVSRSAPPVIRVSLPEALRVPSGLNIPNAVVLGRLDLQEGSRFQAFPNSQRAVVTTILLGAIPGVELMGDPACESAIHLEQVLDLASGRVSAMFQVRGSPVVWDPTGERLVAACRGEEGTSFQVLDANGAPVARLEVDPEAYDGGPLLVSNNAERVAFQPAVGPGPGLAVWSVVSGEKLLSLEGGRGFWLAPDGEDVYAIPGGLNDVYVTVQGGQRFLYTDLNGRAQILRVEVPSGAPTWAIGTYSWEGPPSFLDFGGNDLVVYGPMVGFWYLDENRVFDSSFSGSVFGAVVSPDGRLVVFVDWGSGGMQLHFFERDGRFRITVPVPEAYGVEFGFCLEGRALWVGSQNTAFLGVPE
ncbi:MAG: hypothetical protein MUO38_11815 [Anaerolineales bacterium]|nr:hypothetical protein [Anaerolineales bacterium]